MSTSTLGGHVNTIPDQQAGARRRRRKHSDEFNADAVAACMQPGMSMAAVAMTHGVNANLLRRWVQDYEKTPASNAVSRKTVAAAVAGPKASFVPMTLPESSGHVPRQDIRIELRRGATAITVSWPASAAAECAAWMRELLRRSALTRCGWPRIPSTCAPDLSVVSGQSYRLDGIRAFSQSPLTSSMVSPWS